MQKTQDVAGTWVAGGQNYFSTLKSSKVLLTSHSSYQLKSKHLLQATECELRKPPKADMLWNVRANFHSCMIPMCTCSGQLYLVQVHKSSRNRSAVCEGLTGEKAGSRRTNEHAITGIAWPSSSLVRWKEGCDDCQKHWEWGKGAPSFKIINLSHLMKGKKPRTHQEHLSLFQSLLRTGVSSCHWFYLPCSHGFLFPIAPQISA